MTDKQLLTMREAASYLGCSLTHFLVEVRKQVAEIDLAGADARRPMPRWDVRDLDTFIASRRRVA